MVGLWLGKTKEGNGWYHTKPLVESRYVEKLHIVRHKAFDRQTESDKIIYHIFNSSRVLYHKYIAIFMKGREVLKKEPIDFIITFNVFPYGLISWFLAIIYQKPLVLCFVGTDYNYYFRKHFIRFFIIRACKRADKIICMGSHMIQGLEKIGIPKNKILLHPHYALDSWFEKNTDAQNRYDIITICELKHLKNIDVLIRAIELLANEGISLQTCIVGNGKEEGNLKYLATTLSVDKHIDFVGHQTNVLPFLNQSKIYVQASRSEGLSIALIEAIAAGVVPIVTEAGSEKDVIKDGYNGFFIKIGSPEDMAQKIKLLHDPNVYQKMKKIVDSERYKFTLSNAVKNIDIMMKEIQKK